MNRKFKGEVKRFDGNKCVLCLTCGTVANREGVRVNRLDVHHHYGSMGYDAETVANCVTLCASCHGKVTTKPSSPLARLLRTIMEERKERWGGDLK